MKFIDHLRVTCQPASLKAAIHAAKVGMVLVPALSQNIFSQRHRLLPNQPVR
jgi:hypothetical protein